MQLIKVFALLFAFIPGQLLAQDNGSFLGNSSRNGNEEAIFYAETKQVNQFLRRFNGEEDVRGVKLATTDPYFRSPDLRKKYIPMLFNQTNINLPDLLKEAFLNDMTLENRQKFLEFHGGEWFGEADVLFQRGREMVNITLFLVLVKENLGSKWVISDVYFPPFENLYQRDEMSVSRFLHPMSHELDFMNLDRVFSAEENIGDYFRQDFEVDKLSVFLYELRNRQLKFQHVAGLKFHFFQIDGWYIEISEFNRPGMNRGWLISNLIRLEPGQKERLVSFIRHKQ
ncbi:MAG: hypothetical protein EOM06_06395 [Sphingobacteriia bacterium]|nr:hypothetical protein [Sphingobacteriia bacterium]